MNKKGAEMTIGTLVVIILALLVLIVLAFGFGTGWTNLWSKISGTLSPVNVESVKQGCQISCSTQSKYDYCCVIKDVKFDKDAKAVPVTCNSDSRIKPEDCSVSCSEGVAGVCGELVCGGTVESLKDKDGKPLKAENVCKPSFVIDSTKKLSSSLKPITADFTCCKPV